MKVNEAWEIFCNIGSEKYSVEEKGAAILRVTQMETHNSISKAAMLEVIKFILPLAYDLSEQDSKAEAWVIDECDTTDAVPSRAWIEFHCPKCDTEFDLEEGQYGWYAGKEIPFKFCSICGERLKTENCEVDE